MELLQTGAACSRHLQELELPHEAAVQPGILPHPLPNPTAWLCPCTKNLLSDLITRAYHVCRDSETVKDFLEVVSEYPIVPHPDIFGLHENADITCDQNETYALFATVLSLQPRVASGGGLSREVVVTQQCTSILDKVRYLN